MPVYHSAIRGDKVASKLVVAAQALLEESPLDELTIRAVSERAGVSTLNVYTRFGGKEGLLDVIVREGFEELKARLEACPDAGIADYLRSALGVYRDFCFESKARYELMFHGRNRTFQPSPDTIRFSQETVGVVITRFAAAIAAGETTLGPDANPARVVAGFWGLVHGGLTFETTAVGDDLVDWSLVISETAEVLIGQYCIEH